MLLETGREVSTALLEKGKGMIFGLQEVWREKSGRFEAVHRFEIDPPGARRSERRTLSDPSLGRFLGDMFGRKR